MGEKGVGHRARERERVGSVGEKGMGHRARERERELTRLGEYFILGLSPQTG